MKDEELRKLFSGAGVTPSENAFGDFLSKLVASNAGAEAQKDMVVAGIELTGYQLRKQALLRTDYAAGSPPVARGERVGIYVRCGEMVWHVVVRMAKFRVLTASIDSRQDQPEVKNRRSRLCDIISVDFQETWIDMGASGFFERRQVWRNR